MVWKGRGGPGGKGSTHFHHLYTRRGRTVAAVAAAISSIFRFSPFPGSLPSSTNSPLSLSPSSACLLPLTKQPDGFSPLYFRTGLNHRRGFPVVFAADEKGSGLYLARRTLPPLPRLFRSSLLAIPLIPLWNYDDGDVARAVAELAERATCLTALGRSVINPSHLSASLSIRSEGEEGRRNHVQS